MLLFGLLMGVLAASAVVATVLQVARDGYAPVPTRWAEVRSHADG